MPNLPGLSWDLNVILAYLFGIVLIYLVGRIFLMPLKFIFRLVYNAIIGGIMLWVVNFIGVHFDFTIAINPITALVAGILGIPGVLLLILFKVFIA
ncbi:MAG: sigmaK-factor processing regulatory protein BofA [Firmicutes bacterium]|nr:sigmaK-factor processing regulatory protein BofA [Bacillota bacterium]